MEKVSHHTEFQFSISRTKNLRGIFVFHKLQDALIDGISRQDHHPWNPATGNKYVKFHSPCLPNELHSQQQYMQWIDTNSDYTSLSYHCFVSYFILTIFPIYFILDADTVEWWGLKQQVIHHLVFYNDTVFVIKVPKHYQIWSTNIKLVNVLLQCPYPGHSYINIPCL
jgi:hypothetical protein